MSSIEPIAKIEGSWNEQPVWLPKENSLYWSNRANQQLYRFNAQTKTVESFHCPRLILSLWPREQGGFIATLEDGLAFYHPDKNPQLNYICKPDPFSNNNCFVGGHYSPQHGFWFSTKDRQQQTPSGSIYSLAPDFTIRRFRNTAYIGTTAPVLSKDGSKLYQSCGQDRYIYTYAVAKDGSLQDLNTLCRIPKPEGKPHGLAIDSEDNLWVCHLDGRYISVFSPEGERLEKIKIAASNVTYCCFGGEDLATLYVLTASQGLTQETLKKQPHAGCLLKLETGAKGNPITPYPG